MINIAEIMKYLPLIQQFAADPAAGIADLEKKIIPWWQNLETIAGGPIKLILDRSDHHVSVNLYTAPPGATDLQLWQSFTLFQLLDLIKNIKNIPDATAYFLKPAAPIAGTITAGTTEPAESAGTDNDESISDESDPGSLSE